MGTRPLWVREGLQIFGFVVEVIVFLLELDVSEAGFTDRHEFRRINLLPLSFMMLALRRLDC